MGDRVLGWAQPAGRSSRSTDTTGASRHVSSQPGSLGVGRGAGDTAQEQLQLLCLPLTDAPWQRAARAGAGEGHVRSPPAALGSSRLAVGPMRERVGSETFPSRRPGRPHSAALSLAAPSPREGPPLPTYPVPEPAPQKVAQLGPSSPAPGLLTPFPPRLLWLVTHVSWAPFGQSKPAEPGAQPPFRSSVLGAGHCGPFGVP